jgi:hypothetical protein
MPRRQLGEFPPHAADVAQPHHGAAADGAAFRFQRASGQGDDRGGEALAVVAQGFHQRFHGARLRRLQPGAEGQHAMRRGNRRDHRGVAEDFRLVVARRPGDDDLRLGQQQRMRAVDLGLQRDDLLAGGDFGQCRAAARAHQQHGGNDGEEQDAERERQRRNVVLLEAGDLRDGGFNRGKIEKGGTSGRGGKRNGSNGREESASPRMSLQAPARRPDRIRHVA